MQFEPALKKLGEYLVHLEHEQQYLSNEENNDELLSILNRILLDLNTQKDCTVVVEDYSIQLKGGRDSAEMHNCRRSKVLMAFVVLYHV